jgi:glycerophosphoryl diester phosphodiesterase
LSSLWLTAERTLNIAHQGAGGIAPSNTLTAFRRAADLGAAGIELDVHLSADGAAVVIHDFTVDRTTDGRGRVADLPLAALKELDAGSWFDPAFADERIPTLEEVFEAVGWELLINVELKPPLRDTPALEATVVALVRRHKLTDRVLISSFDPRVLHRVRRLAPTLPLGFLYGSRPISWLTRALARLIPGLTTEAIHPHWTLLRSAGAIRRAHARSRRVVAWTVDEPAHMRQLVTWGVDAIITNHPDRLRTVLEME